MITAAILILGLIITIVIIQRRLSASTNKKETEKENANIGCFIMTIVVIISILINVVSFTEDNNETIPTDESLSSDNDYKLTPEQKFYKDHDLYEYSDLNPKQFAELKLFIESGAMGKNSFCELYQENLDILNTTGDFKAFNKKIKYKNADVIFAFYGPILCKDRIKNVSDRPLITYTQKDVEKQFSNWDGSHIKTEEYVKSLMKNPDSYEHVSSEYKIHPDYLEVILTYRGTNDFNAVTTGKVRAKCDLDTGEVISISEL